jgi:N-acetylmuramoyl-L-alanine amidase
LVESLMPWFNGSQTLVSRFLFLGFLFLPCAFFWGKSGTSESTPGPEPTPLSTLTPVSTNPFGSINGIPFKKYPILTTYKLKLTKQYCLQHYGVYSYRLKNPRMIVIHDTEIASLERSLYAFKEEYFPKFRIDREDHGKVNVGVHFLVAQDGDIYSLLPTYIVGRHIVGFNHVALGIENVGKDGPYLTEKQLEADAQLVEMLVKKYPTIKYLIGHHEYIRKDRPHYRLFKELMADDVPEVKYDPGDKFMRELRERLRKDGIELKD